MKRLWLILFVVPLFAQDNLCSSKEFLRLKNVGINDMNDREYKYFMMMSEKCSETAKATIGNNPRTPEYPHFNSPSKESEFNRKKITIKAGGRTYGGGLGMEIIDGIYAGSVQSQYQSNWVAYQGFSRISMVQFFKITGYTDEAKRIQNAYSVNSSLSKTIKAYKNVGLSFWALATLTLLTAPPVDYDAPESANNPHGIDDSGTYRHLYGMLIFAGVGTYIFLEGRKLEKKAPSGVFTAQPNSVFPLQKAVDMAESYNRQLWNEIK